MTSTVACRAATPEDVPAILDLWERAAEPRSTDNAAALRVAIAHDAELVILAVDEADGVVGSLVAGWDGWRGNMYRLAVDPGYRRRGLAREMVHRAEEMLRHRGASRITSLVIVDEPGAIELWEAAGYEPDPSVQRYAKNLLRA